MRYDITNIPVTEVFEPKDGCPLCRLRDMLEERAVEYITGAAMMEPDIRQETNRQGFCITHYRQMLARRNRLSVALMLESHLEEIASAAYTKSYTPDKRKGKPAPGCSCYVCRQLDEAMDKMTATVCRTWEGQKEFRDLFEQQSGLCFPHYRALLTAAEDTVSKKERPYFAAAARELGKKTLDALRGDVHHFCEMYDYRNAGENADWGNAKDAVERSVEFLTARRP